jgi:hypothetical protein
MKTKVVKMNSKSDKVLANLDKFPHLKNVKESIEKLKEYGDLLERRKVFAKEGYADKSPREKNDIDILLIETDTKISRSRQRIDERTQYFNNYHTQNGKSFDEVLEKYDETRKSAILKSRDKNFNNAADLKYELDEANKFSAHFKTNWELKFRHFLELTKLLTASPAVDEKDLKDVDVNMTTKASE